MHADGYFALVLTEDASARLKEAYATLPVPIAHHCTVRYGTSDPADLPPAFTPADLGRVFHLEVRGFATRGDGGVQAVVVSLWLPDGRRSYHGFSANAVPHVTVATDGEAEPVEANALLEEGFEAIEGGILLAATLLHVRSRVT